MIQPKSNIFELYALGHYNKLINDINANYKNIYVDPSIAKILAASHFKLGNYTKSFEILSELEHSLLDDSEFLSLFAASCRRLGIYEKSSNLFQKALSLNPKSIHIKNNYANLLIDLGQYDEAKSLLNEVLDVDSNFSDAIENINRLSYLVKESSAQATNINQSATRSFILDDPLLLAFASDEVERSSKRYKLLREKPQPEVLSTLPAPRKDQSSQDQIKLAYQACSAGDYKLGLLLCSQALNSLGPRGFIYDCASDLYLNLKQFSEAECCLLQAMAIDGPSPKRLLNLVSFSSMRGDLLLANYYLDRAASLDPSHPNLKDMTKRLNAIKSSSRYEFTQEWSAPELT